jgi:hypothetical protein
MYGFGAETAALWQRPGSPFAGLARASGFSVRDCQVAAATGRLAGIVRVAERRGAGVRRHHGGVPGWMALAQVRAREARW